MDPESSSRLAKVSRTNVGTRGSPYGATRARGGGKTFFAGDGGGIAIDGTSMYIGGGGADVDEVVEGLALEGVFRFFEHVPSQSIRRIVDWSILAPYFRVVASLGKDTPHTSNKCVIITP